MQQLYFPLSVTRVCHIRVYETGLTVECFCKEVVEAEKKGREMYFRGNVLYNLSTDINEAD